MVLGAGAAEFQVNEYTTSVQRAPAISNDSAGGLVIAWQSSGQDGSYSGIFARRFDSMGNASGAEFEVNQFTTGAQSYPAISHDSSGRFVVVWQSYGQDGAFSGIFARRFDSAANPLGAGEFQVNQFTTENQYHPAISHDPTGGFFIVWDSFQDGSTTGVFGRRFDSDGNPVGAEFQINQYTTLQQENP
ncbi:MAG TPA: flagellar hook associated protein, partial [Acidobacteriota bacterium]